MEQLRSSPRAADAGRRDERTFSFPGVSMGRVRASHQAEPTFLTPQEVAARWRISVRKAYALAPELRATKIGAGHIRFPIAHVLEYERRNRIASEVAA